MRDVCVCLLVSVLAVACSSSSPSEMTDAGAGPPDAVCHPERCDGIDNDCDGQIDEGFAVGQPCSVGEGACTREGIQVCSPDGASTVCNAVAAQPSPEICDGIDNNCDGQIDEGFPIGDACQAGVGACVRTGYMTCDAVHGGPYCNAVAGDAAVEQCNLVDDDCDGVVDNVPGLGEACVAQAPGICAQGHQVCGLGALICEPAPPAQEVCNGLDDNCDGQIDEDDPHLGEPCGTGELGVCAAGARACTGGQLVCERTARPAPEICNGLDDDCNGVVDDGCHVLAPRLRFPWNGFLTGSPWIPAGRPSAPLRPRFQWNPSQGADRYEIQIDDSCDPANFRACAFPSPEVAATTGADATSFQPAAILPVAFVPPVGRRYFWRVRACNAAGCSAFSEVRYLDVGRVDGDVNGDGYPDLMIGSSSGAFIYHGGPEGLTTDGSGAVVPSLHIPSFDEVLPVGDLNGDGFADVCARDPLANNFSGNAQIFYGGPSGLTATPSLTIPDPQHTADSFFAIWCFGPGDVDGDGFADLIVTSSNIERRPPIAYLYTGGPTGLGAQAEMQIASPSTTGDAFGFAGIGLGDIDGDGYADFAISDDSEPIRTLLGAVYIYRGGPGRPDPRPSQVIRNTVHPTRIFFGDTFAGGRDLDGDGYADVVISPETGVVGTQYPNAIYAYYGSPDGLVDPPRETLFSPRSNVTAWADSFALGDVDGDGQLDLLTGDRLYSQLGDEQGALELFLGDHGQLGAAPSQLVPNPSGQRGGDFGNQVAVCDLNSDGFADRIGGAVGQNRQTPGEGAAYVLVGSPQPTAVPTWVLDSPDGSPFYGRVVACGQ